MPEAPKIVAASKYASIPQLLIKQDRLRFNIREWAHKQLKEGGLIKEYYAFKKRQTEARLRAVAVKNKDFKQNNDVDARVLAKVPLFDYLMWCKEDPDFWRDNKNLKSYKRDNGDACVYL